MATRLLSSSELHRMQHTHQHASRLRASMPQFHMSMTLQGRHVRLPTPARRSAVSCRARMEGRSPNESGPPVVHSNTASPGFGSLEKLIAGQAVQRTESGGRTDWLEVEGCWVLQPPGGARPQAVAMFCGGAFAGAAPQLTYRLLIECLTKRNILVVAVPFNTGFNHVRIADEAQFKFDRCIRALAARPDTAEAAVLPVYGVGHSLGSLVQLLISIRYSSQRAGNALMSFNNKPLDDVPLIAPFLGPASRVVGPLLSQLSTSPARSALINVLENLRRTSPALVKQFLPVLDQLEPIYADMANGTQEFVPRPEETDQQLRSQYGVPRNLIIHFQSDTLDESPRLNTMMQQNGAVAQQLRYKVLPGDHTRPLLQTVGDVPPEFRQAASTIQSQGEEFLNRLSNVAVSAGFSQASKSFSNIARGVQNVGTALNGSLSSTNAATAAEMQALADEIADWMAETVVLEPPAALPPARRTV